ncbi:hypothetical protein ACFVUS_08410 [Nocardia sp. NPDC058058]|uniref:hypothetical protein n=1 Tax=Nocardia sp. NPDC058058 TaxID=3346317 RepID=UPI0036D8638B
MTGTPPSAPNDPSGDTPGDQGGPRSTARSGQHQNPEPAASATGPEHGRHELPGRAGYPQFDGPGAAQYGEAVEPPPRLSPQSGAPAPQGQPGGYGNPAGGFPPQQGGYAPQQGNPSGGYPPQGNPQGGYPPQGVPPQGGFAPQQGNPQGGFPQQQGNPQGGFPQGNPQGGFGPQGAPQGGFGPGGPQGGYPQQGGPQGYGQPGAPQQGGFPPGSGPGSVPPGSVPLGPDGTPPPGPVDNSISARPYERLDVGHAVSYGWDRFRANPVPWVGMVLIGLIAWLVVTLLINIVNVQSLAGVLLMFAVATLIVWLLQAAMIRGALYETDGTPPDFPAFFGFVNAGSVLLTALIVFVACVIASMLCIFPVVIVGILCMFSLHFVIDQEMDPINAIKASAQLVIANVLQILLLALTVLVITFVGALFCGLGLLLAGPVSAIAVTYAYRFLTGRLVVQY